MAFKSCAKLKEINLELVKRIKEEAFDYTQISLTSAVPTGNIVELVRKFWSGNGVPMNKHRSVTLFVQRVVEREARVSSELIDLINDQNPKDVKETISR